MSTIIFRNHRSADCAGGVLLRRLSHEHHDQQPLPPHQPPQSMARRRSRSALRGKGAGGRRHAPAGRVDGRRRSRGITQCQSAGVSRSPRRPRRPRGGETHHVGGRRGAGSDRRWERGRTPVAGRRPRQRCPRLGGGRRGRAAGGLDPQFVSGARCGRRRRQRRPRRCRDRGRRQSPAVVRGAMTWAEEWVPDVDRRRLVDLLGSAAAAGMFVGRFVDHLDSPDTLTTAPCSPSSVVPHQTRRHGSA